jgi:RHS repeat-associated protein
MKMPGRQWNNGTYRFGFNGKEEDDKVKGEGNQYDYGFRIYDPRVSRFLSVDPLTQEYPWYTPYQYASNSPIANIDLDGLEAAGVGFGWGQQQLSNPKAAENTGKALIAMGRGVGRRLWNMLDYATTHTPWNVDTRAQDDRTQNFTNLVNAVSNPKQTVNNIRQELRETGRKLMSSDPNEVGDAMAGVSVNAVMMYSAFRSITALTRTVTASGRVLFKNVESSSIRVSQETISGSRFERVFNEMKANGWKNQDPLDIVKMEDGIYTTFDHNRLAAAEKLGLDIKATAHNYNDPFPLQRAQDAFGDMLQKGKIDKLPTTWGEAVQARVLNQSKKFATQNPNGSFVRPRITGSGSNQNP